MRLLPGFAAISAGVVMLAGCQSDGTSVTATPDTQVEVEVDIMSGVPNPTWVMDSARSADLADLVAALPGAGAADEVADASDDDALGFRGFVVRGLDLSELGDYDQLRVLGTRVVASNDGGDTLSLQDPELTVYSEVRTASEQHVDPAVFAAIAVGGLPDS